jgi:hypothetical protein
MWSGGWRGDKMRLQRLESQPMLVPIGERGPYGFDRFKTIEKKFPRHLTGYLIDQGQKTPLFAGDAVEILGKRPEEGVVLSVRMNEMKMTISHYFEQGCVNYSWHVLEQKVCLGVSAYQIAEGVHVQSFGSEGCFIIDLNENSFHVECGNQKASIYLLANHAEEGKL